MQVSKITPQDMLFCQQLVNTLKAAEFKVSGIDALALADTMKFVGMLAQAVGETYKHEQTPPPAAPISMGTTGQPAKSGKPRKAK